MLYFHIVRGQKKRKKQVKLRKRKFRKKQTRVVFESGIRKNESTKLNSSKYVWKTYNIMLYCLWL